MRGANRVLPRLINIFLSLEQLNRVSMLHNKSTVKFCTSTNNWDLLRVSRIIHHLTRRKVQSWTLVFHQPALNGLHFLKLSESPPWTDCLQFRCICKLQVTECLVKKPQQKMFSAERSKMDWCEGRGDGRPPGELACNSVSQCWLRGNIEIITT